MHEITTNRANPMIDPGLHAWGPEVAVYLFLGGLVAGLMILTAARRLWRAESPSSRSLALATWGAPVLLTLGMLCLWLDLENRWNAFRFYLVLRLYTPMSWGAWILIAIYPASIAFAWNETPADLRLRFMARPSRFVPWMVRADRYVTERARGVAVANVGLGVLLGIYTGILLGTFAARPLWNSALLGPLFLVSGMSSGAAWLLLHELWPRERQAVARIDMALLVTEIVILGLWFVTLASGGGDSQAAVRQFFGGDYTAAFWTLVVALGLLTPLAGEWLEHRHRAVPGRATALLVLVGGLALRWIVLAAGQHAGHTADAASSIATALSSR